MTTPLKKIVIVGGGAGGLEMATQLGHKLGRKKKAKITLVDRNHSHLWKPLLHEVATGSLDEGVDALSYLAHARNHGFQFQLGSVIDIDREAKTITIAELRDEKGELLVPERKIAYDTLVMALGSTSNDFNTPGASLPPGDAESVPEILRQPGREWQSEHCDCRRRRDGCRTLR